MSLINDALKQVKHAQLESRRSNPPPLPPVASERHDDSGWLAVAIIVLLLAAAGIFAGLSLSKPTPLTASAEPATKSPMVAVAELGQVQPVAISTTVATNVMTNANPVAVAPPKPPEPTLQGILFAANRPCAIVSGQTVFVGDRINEFRVTAISKDSVTMQSKAETKVLSLNPR